MKQNQKIAKIENEVTTIKSEQQDMKKTVVEMKEDFAAMNKTVVGMKEDYAAMNKTIVGMKEDYAAMDQKLNQILNFLQTLKNPLNKQTEHNKIREDKEKIIKLIKLGQQKEKIKRNNQKVRDDQIQKNNQKQQCHNLQQMKTVRIIPSIAFFSGQQQVLSSQQFLALRAKKENLQPTLQQNNQGKRKVQQQMIIMDQETTSLSQQIQPYPSYISSFFSVLIKKESNIIQSGYNKLRNVINNIIKITFNNSAKQIKKQQTYYRNSKDNHSPQYSPLLKKHKNNQKFQRNSNKNSKQIYQQKVQEEKFRTKNEIPQTKNQEYIIKHPKHKEIKIDIDKKNK